ncbi:MAG: hypothetical protein QG552_1011 [Thermodesulfobacteriota bacterium]|nr:hypothetical protein [Thermodesulfobacteriota bacterium]
MVSQKVVTPVNPAEWRDGVQKDVNYMILLDSGFRRNDEKAHFLTFYECINFRHSKLVTSNLKKRVSSPA